VRARTRSDGHQADSSAPGVIRQCRPRCSRTVIEPGTSPALIPRWAFGRDAERPATRGTQVHRGRVAPEAHCSAMTAGSADAGFASSAAPLGRHSAFVGVATACLGSAVRLHGADSDVECQLLAGSAEAASTEQQSLPRRSHCWPRTTPATIAQAGAWPHLTRSGHPQSAESGRRFAAQGAISHARRGGRPRRNPGATPPAAREQIRVCDTAGSSRSCFRNPLS
jgi:hypothetical protein